MEMGETRVTERAHGPRGHQDVEVLAGTGAIAWAHFTSSVVSKVQLTWACGAFSGLMSSSNKSKRLRRARAGPAERFFLEQAE